MRAPWRSIISPDRWKMNLCSQDQGELYDLNTDPWELENLFDQPQHRERVQELFGQIRRWQTRYQDSVPSM